MNEHAVARFSSAAEQVGTKVHHLNDCAAMVAYLCAHSAGPLLLAPCPSLERIGLHAALQEAGLEVITEDFRRRGAIAAAGVTGANFGIAQTGTVVLESTTEAVRISSMLPEQHFVLLDPVKLIADADAAVPLVRRMHKDLPQVYLAYLTGPSRTADIERVLTIGVHGPRELHVLLMPGLSDDYLEA